MINSPEGEKYYDFLIEQGYRYFNYSEKHFVFEKGERIIKIAKNTYNNEDTDESYFIEKIAHDLLLRHNFPAVEIYKIYQKGEFIDDFIVLEEEKAYGKICYGKNCGENYLLQAINIMQKATNIKGNKFGMMNKDGSAEFSSWKEFLYSVVERMLEKEQADIYRKIEDLPKIEESSFVFTDCNMANFVFNGQRLVKVIDVERPLWGDPLFLYGVIKNRNQYMYNLLNKDKKSDIIEIYAKIYPYIFKS